MAFPLIHRDGVHKSIAIVGAGSAGLAALKVLLDLPPSTRSSWSIVLYEQRQDVGGIWLPGQEDPQPPNLPETPLHPALHANTPHPTMTYQGFPFPPFTTLYPSHKCLREYHQRYAEYYNLIPYIHFKCTVEGTVWLGDENGGVWDITVKHHKRNIEHRLSDHLIVASGHHYTPNAPSWPGQDAWLANGPPGGPNREIRHSVFWRSPDRYRNRSVLVLGGGSSGRDLVLYNTPVARKLFLWLKKHKPIPDLPFQVLIKPAVSHFTSESVVFDNGTSDSEIDCLILATGYQYRIPFLERGGSLAVDPAASSQCTDFKELTTNSRYIFPLYEHIFSLSPRHPPNALSFIGLPTMIPNCPSDLAQVLMVAHAIANPSLISRRNVASPSTS